MGCGASANAGQLREAKWKVDELQKKLAVSEAQVGELQRQLQVQQKAASSEATVDQVPGVPSESLEKIAKEAEVKEAEPKESGNSTEVVAEIEASKTCKSSDPGAEVEAKTEAGVGLCVKAEDEPPPDATILPGVVTSEESEPFLADQTSPPPDDAGEFEPARDDLVQESLPSLQATSPQTDLAPPTTNTNESLSLDTLQTVQQSQGPAEQLSESGQPQSLQPAVSEAKLAGSIGSTASTCTPHANTVGTTLPTCCQCSLETQDLFLDPSDMNRYCEQCWSEYYGRPPHSEVQALVGVEVSEIWAEDRLGQLWNENALPGWPPPLVYSTPQILSPEEDWSAVNVRIRREIVGPHAREQSNCDGHPYVGEILAQRYRIKHQVGEGHFTKAFMAEDMRDGGSVCVKRHRNLSVEALADLLVLGRRISDQDEGTTMFPRFMDSFYDVVGYTVESLLEGRNCLSVAQSDAGFFRILRNLRCVARGALEGLAVLDRAGVVHNDIKPDNLIWTEVRGTDQVGTPCVRIVDFGCARLDMKEEPAGRNWSLAEGGAGHLGKWSPEMALRLPITHKGDVWGVAISLCELHCGRFMWRNEADTAEVILAQAIGLTGLKTGLPSALLRRSPLNLRQLYTPAPRHFPLRQNALGQLEALRPTRWGLEQVLGDGWRDGEKVGVGELIERALVVDPICRPSARELLEGCSFVASSDESGSAPPV
mmetsp:Transcript_122438/g.305674  ORF Transcript_122438/g.305674 Transcript_122438/m.305674 type:complete len:710 (+) Transcript_122438:148-2277(+)